MKRLDQLFGDLEDLENSEEPEHSEGPGCFPGTGEELDLNKDQSEDQSKTQNKDQNSIQDKDQQCTAINVKCSAEDALAICFNRLGRVDVRAMAEMAGVSEQRILEVHGGKSIFQDPWEYRMNPDPYGYWKLEAEYLHGNMRRLLREAEEAEEREPGRFTENVRLIRERMPEEPAYEDIRINLGSSWISEGHIADFVAWLFSLSVPPTVTRAMGKWKIIYNKRPREYYLSSEYGTSRISATSIIEHLLGASSIRINDQVGTDEEPKYVLNQEETEAAERKAELIRERFQYWLALDPGRQEKLRQEYCEVYSFAVPHYEGNILSLPGLSPEVTPHRHQKDATMRILLSKDTLLCHDVGSGKTYCYVMAVHELYRLGLSRKNLIVVPNAAFDGTVKIHRKLYPDDRLLLIPRDSFTPANREEIIRKIKEEDVTAIYMAASKFDMLKMTRGYYNGLFAGQVNELKRKKRDAKTLWEKDKYENEIRSVVEKRDGFMEEFIRNENECNCFDELGITTLVVDECQNYKNVPIPTRLFNVIGLNTKGSEKAIRMVEKVRYIRSNTDQKGNRKERGRVVFATGTLLTNSIADLYVFQKYLQPETMKACRLETFGEWVNTFGKISTNFEVDVNGQGYRYVTRVAKYFNLPELMAQFTETCDFFHISQDRAIHLPEFDGFTDVIIPASEALMEVNKLIVKRTDEVRNGEVKASEDNILKIITDGRKAALDVRLLRMDQDDRSDKQEEETEEDIRAWERREKYREMLDQIIPKQVEKETKAWSCAVQVAELYRDHPGTTQIIFCDYSTPKEGFNEYDVLREFLKENGVKEEDIAYIHDAADEEELEKLIERLDQGLIRVMIGSTVRIGIGVNVQTNLLALHHLDAPWRPADLIQREGRIIRQGNTNPKIYQYRYISEKSFDSYVWQILQNKQRFIGSFLSATMSGYHRSEEDIDELELSCAEIKALAMGDPIIRERLEVENRIEREKIAEARRNRELKEFRHDSARLRERIGEQEEKLRRCREDIAHYAKHKKEMPMAERESFAERLETALRDNLHQVKSRAFGKYMGFTVILPRDMFADRPFVYLYRDGGLRYEAELKDRKATSATRIFDGVLSQIPQREKKLSEGLGALQGQLAFNEKELDRGNEHEENIRELKKRLQEIDAKLDKLEEEKNGQD